MYICIMFELSGLYVYASFVISGTQCEFFYTLFLCHEDERPINDNPDI